MPALSQQFAACGYISRSQIFLDLTAVSRSRGGKCSRLNLVPQQTSMSLRRHQRQQRGFDEVVRVTLLEQIIVCLSITNILAIICGVCMLVLDDWHRADCLDSIYWYNSCSSSLISKLMHRLVTLAIRPYFYHHQIFRHWTSSHPRHVMLTMYSQF